MKILVVAANPDAAAFLRRHPALPGAAVVQYDHPLKALDNLGEFDPDLLLWHAGDFPRHWKICRSFSAPRPDDAAMRLVLVAESPLPADEAAKAEAIAVDAVADDGFFGSGLEQVLAAYALPDPVPAPSAVVEETPAPAPAPAIPATGTLIFLNPVRRTVAALNVTGSDGAAWLAAPAAGATVAGLTRGLIIDQVRHVADGITATGLLRVLEADAEGHCKVRFIAD